MGQGSLSPEECEDMNSYNLLALVASTDMSSEELCFCYFVEVVKGLMLTLRKKANQFEKLLPLHCSTDQRPDVTVSRKRDSLPLIVVEVHSSPFATTVQKCIVGVMDQLRLYRMYNAAITGCVGFVFPKPGKCQCVIRVSVMWKELCFCYILTPVQISAVKGVIATEISNAMASAPSPDLHMISGFLIPLSESELRHFFGGDESPVKLPSRGSILVRCGIEYFKSPVWQGELNALNHFSFGSPQLSCAITLHPIMVGLTPFYQYRGMPHDPLTLSEAQVCLHDLVRELVVAIQSIHENGWAHQDIRLENI